MNKAFDDYRWLAGTHGVQGSLWLGPDHLLVVEGRGFVWAFVERYRRIDYKNIQALTLVRTSWWIWLGVLLGLAALVLGVGAWWAHGELPALALTLSVAGAGVFLLMLVHFQRGASCRCFVQTSVQVLRLRALGREKKAVRVLEVLEKACLEKQGEMPLEEEDPLLSPTVAGGPVPPTLPTGAATPLTSLPSLAKPAWPGSLWVVAAGVGVMIWGGALAAELWVGGNGFFLLDGLAGMLSFLLVIVALVRVMRFSSTPAGLKGALWTALGLQLLMGMAAYFGFFVVGVMAGVRAGTGKGMLNGEEVVALAANLSMEDAGVWGFLVMSLGVVLLVLGLLIVIGGRWRKVAPVAKPPPMVSPTTDETDPILGRVTQPGDDG